MGKSPYCLTAGTALLLAPLLIAGCVAVEGDEVDDAPPVPDEGRLEASIAPWEGAAPESNPKPHLEEWTMTTTVTSVSLGDGTHIEDEDNPAIFDCVGDGLTAMRVVLEWRSHPLANAEFGIEFPSEPALVRGPSPLAWEHVIQTEDEGACAMMVLRADGSSPNALVNQGFRGRITYAFHGAGLP